MITRRTFKPDFDARAVLEDLADGATRMGYGNANSMVLRGIQ